MSTNKVTFISKWSLIKNSFIYMIAIGINRGMPLLLTPLLTAFLTPGEYGYLGIAAIILSFLRVFIGLNPSLFVIAKYNLMSRENLSEYVYNIFLVVIATFIIAALCFTVLLPVLQKQYLLDFISISFLLCTAAFMVMEALVLVEIQMEKRADTFLKFSLLSAILQVFFAVITVIVLNWNWKGKIAGDFLASFLDIIVLMIYLRRKGLINSFYSTKKLSAFIKFSIPLLPHSASLWAMNFIDRFFLERYTTIDVVGIYTVAYNFGLGISLFYDALQRTWQPYFYEHIQKEDLRTKAMIVKYTWLYYLGTLVIWILSVIVVGYLAPLLIGQEFLKATQYIPYIFLGYTFQGMYRAVASYLYHLSKTSILALITLASAVLNVTLDIILISENGAMGAAQATCLTYFFSFIVVQIVVMKLYDMPWFKFRKIINTPKFD